MAESFLDQFRRIERQIAALPSYRTRSAKPREERDVLDALSTDIYQLRLVAGDIMTADSYSIRDASIERGTELTDQYTKDLVAASQFDLVTAAEVAQLSAAVEAAWASVRVWMKHSGL